jgi:hypothetical protein
MGIYRPSVVKSDGLAGAPDTLLVEFVAWLRSSRNICLCSPGSPGEMVEDGTSVTLLVDEFLREIVKQPRVSSV